MSYGRTDPPQPVYVDPLVAIGIVVALCVVLILGTCGGFFLGEKEVVWEEGEGWGVEREQRMG
jgi:hypothetical protein